MRNDPSVAKDIPHHLVFAVPYPLLKSMIGASLKKFEYKEAVYTPSLVNFICNLKLAMDTYIKDTKEKKKLLTIIHNLEEQYGKEIHTPSVVGTGSP